MPRLVHPLLPIYNFESKILILGSFPSVKSREESFYYAHPQNRFWKVLEIVFQAKIENKKQFLLDHHIALWDVIASCTITGSADASIKNVKVNDIAALIKKTQITTIFTTGRKAYQLYNKYLKDKVGQEAIYLLSPSPANATCSLNDLVQDYQKICQNLSKCRKNDE